MAKNLLLAGYDAGLNITGIATTNASSAVTTGTVTKFNTSNDAFTTSSTAGFTNGDPITISSLTGTTLSPSQTTYYVNVSSGSTFQLYTTPALTTLVTGTGTGSVTVTGTYTDANVPAVPREIGIVGASGAINTTTTLGASLTGNNVRGAASVDGVTGVYATGPTGEFYTTVGSTTTATLLNGSNGRATEITGNQLYEAIGTNASAGIYTVGSGLPTTTGQTPVVLPGITGTYAVGSGLGGAYEFAFATLNGGTTPDTLYIADNGNYGVEKYSLVSGNWTQTSELGGNSSSSSNELAAISGIVAEPVATGEELFMTTATGIYSFVDTSGYQGVFPGQTAGTITTPIPNSYLTTVATPAVTADEAFRGIEFVPTANGASGIVTQPTNQAGVATSSATFYAAGAPGLNESVQWQVSTGSSFTNLSNGVDANGVTITGATTNTLTLSGLVTAENNNKYQAVFTAVTASGMVSVVSNPATLSVGSPPAFTFDSSNTYTLNENAGTETIKVDLLNPPTTTQTVNFTVGATGDTAVAGTNYGTTVSVSSGTVSGDSGTLSFPSGTTSETITIPILAAAPQGGNKTVTVKLSSPISGSVISGTATEAVTIVDVGETFSLSNATYSVNDTDGQATISVTRTGDLTDSPTITYNTSDGTAMSAKGDYSATTGTVSFSANQTTATFEVTVGTITAGSTKTFSVHIGGPYTGGGVPAYNASASTATVSIVDASTYSNNLSGSPATGVSVEAGGPYTTNYADVVGDTTAGVSSYLGYELLTFSPASATVSVSHDGEHGKHKRHQQHLIAAE